MRHDTLVVGAGIAGLWIADQLAKRGESVLVLEKSDEIGGRIHTSTDGLQLEIGAGRISSSHPRVMELVKRFNLQTYPHSKDNLWLPSDPPSEPQVNAFSDIWNPLLAQFKRLSPSVLATHTLRELAVQTIGQTRTDELLNHFGFRGETDVLRADLGIRAFEHEMHPDVDFVGIRGGISGLIRGLSRGLTIRRSTEVDRVVLGANDIYTVHVTSGKPSKNYCLTSDR